MLPRNGKALSQPHEAWPVLALDAYLLRCRDKAPHRHNLEESLSDDNHSQIVVLPTELSPVMTLALANTIR
jgi:hypothetical protein